MSCKNSEIAFNLIERMMRTNMCNMRIYGVDLIIRDTLGYIKGVCEMAVGLDVISPQIQDVYSKMIAFISLVGLSLAEKGLYYLKECKDTGVVYSEEQLNSIEIAEVQKLRNTLEIFFENDKNKCDIQSESISLENRARNLMSCFLDKIVEAKHK